MSLKIRGIHHIVLTVSETARSARFCEEILGGNVATAGIEYDPDGKSDYVCFRDPDNIQVEFYPGDYGGG